MALKKLFLSSASLFFLLKIHSQTSAPDVLASGGGFVNGPGFSNSFTIGQGCLTETYTQGNFILTQGFQQPFTSPTGINSFAENSFFETFPNPSNGIFFLDYPLKEAANVTVEVFDAFGQKIYSVSIPGNSGSNHEELDLSGQPNGIYFVQCTVMTSSPFTSSSRLILSR